MLLHFDPGYTQGAVLSFQSQVLLKCNSPGLSTAAISSIPKALLSSEKACSKQKTRISPREIVNLSQETAIYSQELAISCEEKAWFSQGRQLVRHDTRFLRKIFSADHQPVAVSCAEMTSRRYRHIRFISVDLRLALPRRPTETCPAHWRVGRSEAGVSLYLRRFENFRLNG
jgi:hypothetical protein